MNQYESENIAGSLTDDGWILARDNEAADLCIINTCTVTQKASMQSRQAIRQLIRSNPDAMIIVTGCYAQIEPSEIKKIPGVHHIIGDKDKNEIRELLKNQESGVRSQESGIITINRTRPFLKIQDGCNAFCTYCIVPYALWKKPEYAC